MAINSLINDNIVDSNGENLACCDQHKSDIDKSVVNPANHKPFNLVKPTALEAEPLTMLLLHAVTVVNSNLHFNPLPIIIANAYRRVY